MAAAPTYAVGSKVWVQSAQQQRWQRATIKSCDASGAVVVTLEESGAELRVADGDALPLANDGVVEVRGSDSGARVRMRVQRRRSDCP